MPLYIYHISNKKYIHITRCAVTVLLVLLTYNLTHTLFCCPIFSHYTLCSEKKGPTVFRP